MQCCKVRGVHICTRARLEVSYCIASASRMINCFFPHVSPKATYRIASASRTINGFQPVSQEENYRIVLAPQLIKGSQAMSPEVRRKAKPVSANPCSPGCRTNYSRLVTQFGRHNRSSMQLIFGHEFLVFPAYPATNDNELW